MSEKKDIVRLNPITTGVSYVESQDVPSYSSAQFSMPLVTFEYNPPAYKVPGNKEYCKSVYNSLVEGGFDEDAMSLIIMGGGANIVKTYGGEEFLGAEFLLDTKANAKGYEAFMRKYQEKIGG